MMMMMIMIIRIIYETSIAPILEFRVLYSYMNEKNKTKVTKMTN